MTDHSASKPKSESTRWGVIALVFAIALVSLTLAAPPIEVIELSVSPDLRAWLEWGKFATELLLVLLFGGAVFSDGVAQSVERACVRIDAKLDAEHQDFRDIFQKISAGERLSWDDWKRLAKRLTPNFASPANPLSDRDFRLMLWLSTRGMPKGLFGLIALILFLAKVGIDVILLQSTVTA
ncbi:hypothetical protein [Pontixanthobacter sp. CEM42]|uniref:hypothetical protein n=1 Tax=Pontixanthobacter sp. CEM42 TaxID=2792077 RepID=UPI001AE03247|nr:hypothetical protein [Pontixanthobacter sp. CEM42]